MSTTDSERQLEAEDLAQTRKMTEHMLQEWDLITWNDLLAPDVALSVRVGSIDIDRVGDLPPIDGKLQVSGREDAERALKSIYHGIKRGLCVTSEVLSGYEVVLVGNLSLESTKEGDLPRSWPIAIYMKLNANGRISVMTIGLIDLQPLIDAIRSAAQTGALTAA